MLAACGGCSSENYGIDARNPLCMKGFARRIECRARGADIVNEQDVPPCDTPFVLPVDHERVGDISHTRRPVQPLLRACLPSAA